MAAWGRLLQKVHISSIFMGIGMDLTLFTTPQQLGQPATAASKVAGAGGREVDSGRCWLQRLG